MQKASNFQYWWEKEFSETDLGSTKTRYWFPTEECERLWRKSLSINVPTYVCFNIPTTYLHLLQCTYYLPTFASMYLLPIYICFNVPTTYLCLFQCTFLRLFDCSTHNATTTALCCGQSYEHFTIVNYDSRVENTPYYDSRVVNYDHKLFIRLATDVLTFNIRRGTWNHWKGRSSHNIKIMFSVYMEQFKSWFDRF